MDQSFSLIVNRLRAAGCVFAEDEAQLLIDAAQTPADLEDMVERRVVGHPLEHVLGWAEFCGLRIVVGPGVFVPRYRTEFLVQQAATLTKPGSVVVDLCCGSGALGAAIAASRTDIALYAADIDPVAVDYARRNVAPYGGQVFTGDLFAALPDSLRNKVNVLVANVPYVPTDSIRLMPPEARLFEPLVALDGGPDGLDMQRRVAASARDWLAPGGHLLVETAARQVERSVEIFASYGLIPRVETDDELDATIVIGTKP